MQQRYLFFCLLVILGGKLALAVDTPNPNSVGTNFQEIKKVLQNDFLSKHAIEKEKKIDIENKNRKASVLKLYNLPNEYDFWSFLSELWLVKNAASLHWDFEKPDYGLKQAMISLLETLGFYEIKFKILLLNGPAPAHFALPANPNALIFLLSVPFIRTMDLTKLEIALLLLEDFFRVKMGYMKDYCEDESVKKVYGGNFFGKKSNKKIIDEALKRYSYFIFKKGFSFQQQFQVTKKQSAVLKSDLSLLSAYGKLLRKIDSLVKNNLLYKDYNNIYPSPEMQLKWLAPSK